MRWTLEHRRASRTLDHDVSEEGSRRGDSGLSMAWSEATGSASASELHALIILESVGSGGSMSRAPSEQGSLMAWILGVSALAGVLVSLGSYFAVAGWMSDESMRGSAELPIAVFIPTAEPCGGWSEVASVACWADCASR